MKKVNFVELVLIAAILFVVVIAFLMINGPIIGTPMLTIYQIHAIQTATALNLPTATPPPWWQFWRPRFPTATLPPMMPPVTPIRPPEYSNCIGWDRIDRSYLGHRLCVKGIVESSGQPGEPLFFSAEPHSFYVAYAPLFPGQAFHGAGFQEGDCIMAYGDITLDRNQTLYINTYGSVSCP